MAVKTYSSPGKKRKQCPQCLVYVGFKVEECVCGRKFPTYAGNVKVYDGPGKKRKQCPVCEVYVGYSTPICVCGFDFENQPEELPAIESGDRVAHKKSSTLWINGGQLRPLLIPNGAPPVTLTKRDKASIIEWTKQIRTFWAGQGYKIAARGVIYWLDRYIDPNDDVAANEAACKIITKFLEEEDSKP